MPDSATAGSDRAALRPFCDIKLARLRNAAILRTVHPGISIVVDQVGAYGRQVLRGVMVYSNTRAHWELRLENGEQMRRAVADGLAKGVIIQLTGTTTHMGPGNDAPFLIASGLPAVNISSRLRESPFPRVANDDAAIGRMVAEYFLARGFRNFGFVGLKPTHFSWVRGESFAETIRKAGHEAHLGNHAPDAPMHQANAAWLRALPVPCAILAADDNVAKGLVKLAAETGLRIPEDIAVVGVENDPLLCELAGVPISSVQTGAEKVGFEAARLLDQLMRGEPPPALDTLVPPQGIVTRRSSDIMAIDDPHVVTALRLINDRSAQRLRPADVLRQIPLSRRMAELRFKKAAGRTIGAEIQRVRLERAKRLLTESDLQIGEVAVAAGFGEARYLNIAFRQVLGMTPKAFRRQHRLV